MHTAYLEAKRAIDDRSINRTVWDAMVRLVADSGGDAVRIAEIGAGTGTMIDRLRDWGALGPDGVAGRAATYDAWEMNPETAAVLAERTAASEFARAEVHVGDLREWTGDARFDLVIAHAVLDLFSPQEVAALMDRLLTDRGVLYASIVFDGVTLMEPAIDAEIDDEVLRLYHRSMRQGFGRRQLWHLWDAGFEIVATGSSDWVIPPRRNGPRPEERELVGTILEMMRGAVTGQLETGASSNGDLTVERLNRWIDQRHRQLQAGDLFFAAHQIDFVARR